MLTGEVLKFIRFRKGWGQSETAKRAGLSQGYYSKIENGNEPMNDKVKQRLLAAFELSESDVLKVWNYLHSLKGLNI